MGAGDGVLGFASPEEGLLCASGWGPPAGRGMFGPGQSDRALCRQTLSKLNRLHQIWRVGRIVVWRGWGLETALRRFFPKADPWIRPRVGPKAKQALG